MPASTSYQLKDYGFGNGGTGSSSSTNYSITGITGEQSGTKTSSASYGIGSGLVFVNQSNVPGTPVLTNPNNYYNKLQIILDAANDSTDTKFAIAISSDGFVTTKFVQNDHTVGLVLGSEDYQTYAIWGGANGTIIIGLTAGTTYQVKVKAMQGRATETGYGPAASAATSDPMLSFGISANSINFGELIPNSVSSSPQNIVVNFSTNAENGGKVYVSGNNAGLLSTTASYKIDAVSGDLSSLEQGFGIQGVSTSQTAGGPLAIAPIYNNLGGNIVGITDQIIRDIFNVAAPVAGGSGVFTLKAKPSSITPSASDYKEILTIVAAGSF